MSNPANAENPAKVYFASLSIAEQISWWKEYLRDIQVKSVFANAAEYAFATYQALNECLWAASEDQGEQFSQGVCKGE